MDQVAMLNNLKEYLITHQNAISAAGGKEVVKRCHLCGDSRDPKSRHMYIGIDKRTGLLSYNCFKCGESGIVSSSFIRNMGDYDCAEVAAACDRYNNEIFKKPGNTIQHAEGRKFISPRFFIRESEQSEKKLQYINNRLGLSLDYADLNRMKIILNLYDFLNANHIETLTRHPSIVGQLDGFFLGFLSVDNSYINMRRLIPEGKLYETVDKRYVNYNVFGKIDNSQRYYVIPGSVNITSPERIKIHVSEGPFDNMSIYCNVERDNHENSIFANIGGKSYLNIAKFFIQTYGLINIEYHIYPDADVENFEIQKLANYLRPFGIPLYMHRNAYNGEKDFGVRSDRIINQCIKL